MDKRLLVLASLLFIACAPLNFKEVPNENFSVSYSDGMLKFKAKITKPTPCHTVDVYHVTPEPSGSRPFGSCRLPFTLFVEVNRPPEGTYCIQVLQEEVIEEEFVLAKKPDCFAAIMNDETVFATTKIKSS
jgi:hypothetical protein